MFRGKCRQAFPQRFTRILLLDRHFGIVSTILDRVGRLVVQFSVLPASERRKGLEPCNRQKPGGNGGSAFEFSGLTPHIEKNLADEIFRNLLVPDEPKPKTEHPDMVPSVQHLHGESVALSDPGDKDFVRSRLCRAQRPSRRFGRVKMVCGSKQKVRFFSLAQLRKRICDLPHRRLPKFSPCRACKPSTPTLGIIIL